MGVKHLQQIAAVGDLPAGEANDDVLHREAGGIRRRVRVDAGDPGAALGGQAEGHGQARRDVDDARPQVGAAHLSLGEQLLQDWLRQVDRDGKADALGTLDDGRVDPDDPSEDIDQGFTAVAGVGEAVTLLQLRELARDTSL